MTQEEKELLRKDLCARLPYGVKAKVLNEDILRYDYSSKEGGFIKGIENINDGLFVIKCRKDGYVLSYDEFKPYLFPLSSITKEMMEEPNIYGFFKYRDTIANVGHLESKNGVSEEIYTYIDIESVSVLIEFFHSHHIDYRGLIEKGLAIDATGLDIYK